MYKIARIKIIPNNIGNEDFGDLTVDFLSMLYKNGQILSEYIVENHTTYYLATVTTTDDDSLDSKYFNQYIKMVLEKIDYSVEIVSDDALSEESCKCKEHDFYFMAPVYSEESSPVYCGNCGKEIPLIHLPYINNDEEHFWVLSFQREFKAVDTLWMDSLSDRFTRRQLLKHDSQLSKAALGICRDLEEKVKKPVLYLMPPKYMFSLLFKKDETIGVCPKCGKQLEMVDTEQAIDKVCWDCRLGFKEASK